MAYPSEEFERGYRHGLKQLKTEKDKSYMEGYRAANAEAKRDWKAFVADLVMEGVQREAVTSHMIDVRGMTRTIKFLLDHVDECRHIEFPMLLDGPNQLLTTLDWVEDWLSNMEGALGSGGYEDSDDEPDTMPTREEVGTDPIKESND